MRHPLLTEINATCDIPFSWLDGQWSTITAAVKSVYSLSETDPTFTPVVLGMLRKALNEASSHTHKIDKLFMEAVIGEIINPKPPTAKTLPNNITIDAVPLWKAMFKKYRARIYKYKDNVEKWAAAIAILKRLSAKAGVTPFSKGPTNKAANPAINQLRNQITKGIARIAALHDLLINERFAKKVSKPLEFMSIKKQQKETLVNLKKSVPLLKKANAGDALEWLVKKARLKKTDKRNVYKTKVGQKFTILVSHPKKSGQELTIRVQLSVNPTTMTKIESLDKPTVFFRKWAKKRFAGASSRARIGEEIASKYNFRTARQIIGFLNSIDLQFIVESGNEDYQIALLRYLIGQSKQFGAVCPMTFYEFLKNSNYRKRMQKKYAKSPDITEDKIIGPGA